jgi:hypothetical protein
MKQVDELIRGELAAIRSIDAILNKIKDQNEKNQLSSMRQDHVKACDKLKQYAGSNEIKEVKDDGGPWGSFAKSFTSGASFFGDKAAIKALKVGEEYGLRDYKEALNADGISSEVKEVIRNELLPQQEQHIRMIENYLH